MGLSIVVVGINIILNTILIYGCLGFPRMEIAGAALATIIGNLLGEGNLSEARKSGNILCKIAVFSGLLTGGMILLLIPVILLPCGALWFHWDVLRHL